jgi:hypothetical protein
MLVDRIVIKIYFMNGLLTSPLFPTTPHCPLNGIASPPPSDNTGAGWGGSVWGKPFTLCIATDALRSLQPIEVVPLSHCLLPIIIILCYVVCSWLCHDSIFPSTYRGLVTNGSLGFSTKKVECPASLVKSGGIFYHTM